MSHCFIDFRFGKIYSRSGPTETILSKENHLAINMYSGSTISREGFFATYEVITAREKCTSVGVRL